MGEISSANIAAEVEIINAKTMASNTDYRFDIKRLAADCEANYARLRRLLPGLCAVAAAAPCDSASLLIELRSGEPLQLTATVQQRCRYTTMLELVFQLAELRGAAAGASRIAMEVRLYHDVKTAEVVSWNRQRSQWPRNGYPNAAMYQPDEKSQQNRFLAEWLGLGLQCGLTLGVALPFAAPRGSTRQS